MLNITIARRFDMAARWPAPNAMITAHTHSISDGETNASFDFVIFFASLEHMTHGERLRSLRAAWRLLADDGIRRDVRGALGPIPDLDFMVDRQTFQMKQNHLRWLYYRRSSNRRYANLLRRQRPDLPFGLFMPYLNIAIRKKVG